MSLQRNLTLRNRFRPAVEDLEGRWVPTVLVTPAGGSLTINGAFNNVAKNQNHSIQIIDDGKGDVSVTADGVTSSFTNISSISIKGGNKADNVFYEVTGPVTQSVNVSADLGGGHNSFIALVEKDVKAGGSVAFSVNNTSSTGKDVAAVNVLGGVDLGGSLAVTVNPSKGGANESVNLLGNKTIAGTVQIDLEGTPLKDSESVQIADNIDTTGFVMAVERGKPGNDTESMNFSGQDKGTLMLQADGGPGADTINVQVNLAKGSTGAVIANEMGGPGNDTLTLAVRTQQGDNTAVTADVDGGPGNNTAMITPNVTPTNIQHVIPIM